MADTMIQGNITREDGICFCGVPINLHGTCCGWINATVRTTSEWVVLDKRHPAFGQNLLQWKQKELQS